MGQYFRGLEYVQFAYDHYVSPKYDLASSNVQLYDLNRLEASTEHLGMHPASLAHIVGQKLAQIYDVPLDQLAITPGASGGISYVAQALKALNIYKLAVEFPVYEPLWQTPDGLGLDVIKLKRRDRNNRFVIDPEDVRNCLEQGARAFIITNPHNPTGTLLSHDELRPIIKLIEEADAYLFIDEIYLDFYAPMAGLTSFNLSPNVFITTSMTKVYGMGALRSGWVLGSPELIEQVRLCELYFEGSPSSPALAYWYDALEKREEIRNEYLQQLVQKAKKVTDYLKSGPFEWSYPGMGMIGLLKTKKEFDDIGFTKKLIAETGVVIAPGTFFGMPNCFRLGLGSDLGKILKGIDIIVDRIGRV